MKKAFLMTYYNKIDVIFINGLSCGDGTQTPFINEFAEKFSSNITIHRPNLKRMDRSSTYAALNSITREFSRIKNPVVIGHSLGGLWAIYLARMGFTDRIIAISPALPTNFQQIDLLRLKLFLKSLGLPLNMWVRNIEFMGI